MCEVCEPQGFAHVASTLCCARDTTAVRFLLYTVYYLAITMSKGITSLNVNNLLDLCMYMYPMAENFYARLMIK